MRRSPRAAALLILAIVGCEAVLLLHVWGLGSLPLVVHDYRVWDRLAQNVLDHATFSSIEGPPLVPTTFRPPGYPVFIAAVYAAAGRAYVTFRAVQFLLLACTALVLYVIGRRVSSLRAAMLIAVAAATYPPFVFVAADYADATMSTLAAICAVLILFVLVRRPRASLWGFLGLGAALGLLTLIRPGFTFLSLFIVAGVALVQRSWSWRFRMLACATMLLGQSVVIAPWIARNTALTGRVTNVSTAGGWSLYVSAQQYAGEISYQLLRPEWDIVLSEFNRRTREAVLAVPRTEGAEGAPEWSLTPRQELFRDRSFSRDALEKLRRVSVGQVVSSWPHRVFWLWSTADVSLWRTGLLHRFIQVHYVVFAGLVLAGLYLWRRSLLEQWPLWILAVYLTVLHSVFHVEARYTLEARAPLLIYAGLAIDRLVRSVRSA